MARPGRVPGRVGPCKNRPVGSGGIRAPTIYSQDFGYAAHNEGLAGTGFADDQGWPDQDSRPADQIGEHGVDNVLGVGKLEQERLPDPLEWWRPDQGQGLIDNAFELREQVLEPGVLQLLLGELRDHALMLSRRRRWNSLVS